MAPIVALLFKRSQGDAQATVSNGAFAIELNAALAMGLDSGKNVKGSSPAVRSLCAQYLVLEHAVHDAPEKSHTQSVGLGSTPWGCVQIRYDAPPPLHHVLSPGSVRIYSAVMALLLRVKHAQAKLLQVHSLPLFGVYDAVRRAWPSKRRSSSVSVPDRLMSFAHSCDLTRAGLSHFLGSLERYFRVDVLNERTRILEQQLRTLADLPDTRAAWKQPSRHGAVVQSSRSPADVVECAVQLHDEFLLHVCQGCFLAPELSSVLADLEHLIDLALEMCEALDGLADHVHWPGKGCEDQTQETALVVDAGAGGAGNVATANGEGPASEAAVSKGPRVSWDAGFDDALLAASAKIERIQREFQLGARYLVQVLTFSVARGENQQVARLCVHMNFNSFYY